MRGSVLGRALRLAAQLAVAVALAVAVSAALPASGWAGSRPKVTVSPRTGGPTTTFVARFRRPQVPAHRTLIARLRLVSAPTTGFPCLASTEVALPSRRIGAVQKATFAVRPGTDWCGGTWQVKVGLIHGARLRVLAFSARMSVSVPTPPAPTPITVSPPLGNITTTFDITFIAPATTYDPARVGWPPGQRFYWLTVDQPGVSDLCGTGKSSRSAMLEFSASVAGRPVTYPVNLGGWCAGTWDGDVQLVYYNDAGKLVVVQDVGTFTFVVK